MESRSLAALVVLVALAILFGAACSGDDDDNAPAEGDDAADDDSDDDVDDDSDDDAGDDTADDDTSSDDDDLPGKPEPFDPTQPGPYQVGNKSVVFLDTNRYPNSPFGGRRLLTEIWYPAADETAALPRDTPRAFLQGWDELVLGIFRLLGVPGEEIDNFDRETGSAREAPLFPGGGPFPLVVFSHGFAGIRVQNYTMAEYLASHGYIVAACDHTKNAFATTFPEGVVPFNPLATPFSYTHRMKDLSFLIDEFTRLNENDPTGFWTGRVDLTRVGAIGHSFGGTAVLQDTKRDTRIGAAVDLASFMFPFIPGDFDAPLLFMMGSEDHTMDDLEPLIRLNFAESPAPKGFLEFYDGGHYTFTDACILVPTLFGEGDGCGTADRKETGEPFDFIEHDHAFEIIDSYITAFFGAYLKDQPEDMLPYLRENHFPDDIDHAFYEPEGAKE